MNVNLIDGGNSFVMETNKLADEFKMAKEFLRELGKPGIVLWTNSKVEDGISYTRMNTETSEKLGTIELIGLLEFAKYEKIQGNMLLGQKPKVP